MQVASVHHEYGRLTLPTAGLLYCVGQCKPFCNSDDGSDVGGHISTECECVFFSVQ